MKALFLSKSDLGGGAARATHWLAKGLRRASIDIAMLVEEKNGDDYWVDTHPKGIMRGTKYLRSRLDSAPIKFSKDSPMSPWSTNIIPNPGLVNRIKLHAPDIINIHWVGAGYMPIKQIPLLNAPVVWSLYDMWPFTGGCHYDNFCDKFASGCGRCPQLGSESYDVSKYISNTKTNSWRNTPMTIVAPSTWLRDQVSRSSILGNKRIEVIPHGTDLQLFKPIDKSLARDILGIAKDKKYILFGSTGGTSDARKGYQYLRPALEKLKLNMESRDIEILIFGMSEPLRVTQEAFPTHYFGRLHDDVSLAVLYAAADVTVTPSLQEAFGMTASESMACGTPVVAFGASGPLDVIDHIQNGYLAKPYDSDDLSNGIRWILEDGDRLRRLSGAARKKCEIQFDLKKVTADYLSLYDDIIKNSR